MKRKYSNLSISEYCLKHGYEDYVFFNELKKHPAYADRLRKNENGEYVTDLETLKYIGDKLSIIRDNNRRRYKKDRYETSESAVAAHINSLVSENEELRKEVRRLRSENRRLRCAAEIKEQGRRKKQESQK